MRVPHTPPPLPGPDAGVEPPPHTRPSPRKYPAWRFPPPPGAVSNHLNQSLCQSDLLPADGHQPSDRCPGWKTTWGTRTPHRRRSCGTPARSSDRPGEYAHLSHECVHREWAGRCRRSPPQFPRNHRCTPHECQVRGIAGGLYRRVARRLRGWRGNGVALRCHGVRPWLSEVAGGQARCRCSHRRRPARVLRRRRLQC